MSEVLMVLPAPAGGLRRGEAVTEAPERLCISPSFRKTCARLGGSNTVAAAASPLYAASTADILPPSLEEEEKYCRILLLLQYRMEHVALLEWFSSVKTWHTREALRRRTESVVMQEALLQHRISRFAHLEQRHGSDSEKPKTHCVLLQDEMFGREFIELQETHGRFTVWFDIVSRRSYMERETNFYKDFVMASSLTIQDIPNMSPNFGNVNRIKEIHTTSDSCIQRMQSDMQCVCNEAEALSFALDMQFLVKSVDELQSTPAVFSVEQSGIHAQHAVIVMQAAVHQIDNLRSRLHETNEKLREGEHALNSSRRKLEDEGKRTAEMRRLLDATEEAAAAAASQCQLQLSTHEPHKLHVWTLEQQLENSPPATYTMSVLQEFRRCVTTLTKEMEWQQEKIHQELRDRDAAIGIVCCQVERLAALLQSSPNSGDVRRGSISISNVAFVLESITASVAELKKDDTSKIGNNSQETPEVPQSTPQEEEVKSLREIVENMRVVIDMLSQKEIKDDKNGDASVLCATPVMEGKADIVTMVLRRLEEVRGEKIQLELALEEAKSHQSQRRAAEAEVASPFVSSATTTGHAASADVDSIAASTRGMVSGDVCVQSLFKIREANALLQEELKLEREMAECIKAKLSDSYRFIRELQQQCRRLRQSGRFDSYEVVQQLADNKDSSSDSSDKNSENDAGVYTAGCKGILSTSEQGGGGGGGEKKFEGNEVFLSDNWWKQRHQPPDVFPSNRRDSSVCNSTSSLETTSGVEEPFFALNQESKAQCLMDQRRVANTLCSVQGLTICTLHMSKECGPHRCDAHEISNMFVGCSISFHSFFRRSGLSSQSSRSIAVLYPLLPTLAHRLPTTQLLRPLRRRGGLQLDEAFGTALRVLDLRKEFQSTGKYLNGCMDVCFSSDGRFAYALSTADSDALARLCSPEGFDIPTQNRFRFSGSIQGSSKDLCMHPSMGVGALPMDVLGWCGIGGICAWATECMRFDSPAEEARFEQHLKSEFRLVLRLSVEEVKCFVGGSVELMGLTPAGKVLPRLFMSLTAFKALTAEHRMQLMQWYGGKHGILVLNVGSIERLTSAPLRRLVAMTQWHSHVPLSKVPPPRFFERLGLRQYQHRLK